MHMPRYPSGVPSQFEAHVHPWPTRYHGPIYTRPVFGLPYVQSPYAVFKPGDFSATATAGFGADLISTALPGTPLAPAMSERKQGMLSGFFIGLVTGAVIALITPKRKRS